VASGLVLVGAVAAAVFIVSQFGGLDRQELAGMMNASKPEQARLTPESDSASGDVALSGEEGAAPVVAPAAPEAPQAVVPPPSDLVTSTVRSVRNVTAPGMTPAPVVTGPLEREAVPKRPPPPPRWKKFSPVTVHEAGLLDLGARKVRLAGIVAPAEGRLCRPPATGDATAEMPCARLAMVALRSRIRAFGVECQVSTSDDTSDPAIAPCRIGKTDLALWMIEQGWAEAAPKAPDGYAAAEKAARCGQRGIWRAEGPPADCLQN
jgi:endonuclease YncB( thermonuclease family)